MSVDTDVLIIGTGISGLCQAIQLVRQFGSRNFEIIEKSGSIGGTWFVNSYPGCGCDVKSHFYSYSFAQNPNWSRHYALQPEIHQYVEDVAAKYDIRPHVRFHAAVKTADYEPETATWRVVIEDQKSKRQVTKRCRILVSAVGGLSIPRKCDIPGVENFGGSVFHSAEWDHSFDYSGKNVVCVGNGCSATQFVPIISDGPGKVQKVTQFCRQTHWLSERPNPYYSDTSKFLFRWVPGLQSIYRAYIYASTEADFAGFHVTNGKITRDGWTKETTDYIKKTAPAKYHDMIIPKTVIGCKRRVMDTDYLECLHRDNVELVHDDQIDHITETGVMTKSGRAVDADAIIMANGFETQTPLFPMVIRGQNGQDIADHWHEFADGSPEAYFGTCLSGFPNFFILMGPNTLSGHLSVMYTTECQVMFVIRAIRPILAPSRKLGLLSGLLGNRETPDAFSVTAAAERRDVAETDRKAKDLVWASGCTSWFIDPNTGRNTIMFPDYQFKLWLRSVFLSWDDFIYTKASRGVSRNVKVNTKWSSSTIATGLIVTGALVGLSFRRDIKAFANTAAWKDHIPHLFSTL